MSETVPYDDWASIYDVWADSAPVTRRNLPFYVRRLLEAKGVAVELGVGNGRIAIEAAKKGADVIGVDSSSAMLSLCRQRAREAGVLERLTLIKADFRDFLLREPADLVLIPFHSIGHLLTLEDKRACLEHVRGQLAPGGRLVFDHFVFDPAHAEATEGASRLRGEYVDPESGRDALLWVTVRYDLEAERMRIYAVSEEFDPLGVMVVRRARAMDFSWIRPEATRRLLEEAGYEIEACWGSFDETPFADGAREQIWTARRPS
jgi:SAM-dependent methyltransferase